MIDSGNHSPALRQYYKTPAWKDLSYRVKKRDNFRCRACNKRPMHREWWQIWRPNDWLVAHHMDYRAWERDPGNEPMSDLISLCAARITMRFMLATEQVSSEVTVSREKSCWLMAAA